MPDVTLNEQSGHRRPHMADAAKESSSKSGVQASSLSDPAPGTSNLFRLGALRGHGSASVYASQIQRAQQTHGNRAVQRFLQRSAAPQLSIQREASDEDLAKSTLGDAEVKTGDPSETDTMSDKEYAGKMSSSTVEEPKAPGEGVAEPDKGNSAADEQARLEREKQDDKEIYDRELRRAQQERMRDSTPLSTIGEENLRGQVRDGAFTPFGGRRRANPYAMEPVQRSRDPMAVVSVQREEEDDLVRAQVGDASVDSPPALNTDIIGDNEFAGQMSERAETLNPPETSLPPSAGPQLPADAPAGGPPRDVEQSSPSAPSNGDGSREVDITGAVNAVKPFVNGEMSDKLINSMRGADNSGGNPLLTLGQRVLGQLTPTTAEMESEMKNGQIPSSMRAPWEWNWRQMARGNN